MNSSRLFTILLVGIFISSCAQFKHYRIQTQAAPPIDSNKWPPECAVDQSVVDRKSSYTGNEDKLSPGELCQGNPASPVSSSIQHRFYTESFVNEDGKSDQSVTRDYYLSFVEFDDQGGFADRKQMEALFALLKKLKDEEKHETLIYVYAHGWKHNANVCDNNVICFSRLIERLDLVEKKILNDDPKTQRTVVGVYLGWRGLPFGTALNNLSFWSRKDAAARVGRGSVFELLTKLKDYRDDRQKDTIEGSHPTQLVITGHSFGGLIIYEALSHALMERAAKTTMDTDGTPKAVAKSFGDFVMLVNPAFEGSLYEPLFQIATHREYISEQPPVMLIVSSDADNATKYAFPFGRGLSTILQHSASSEQRESMLKTIGHNERYVTHDLIDKKTSERKIKDTRDCGCKYLEPTAEWSQTGLLNILSGFYALKKGENDYSGDPVGKLSEAITLTRVLNTTYPSNYPYLVVKTNESLIPDHNAIYEDRFTTFTQLFILYHIVNGFPLPVTEDE